MKYTIEDLREAETKELDVTQFFPKAKEPVIITIKRLNSRQHARYFNFIALAQFEITQAKADGIPLDQVDLSGWDAARMETLLGGVIQDDKLPFEKWDKETIEAVDKRDSALVSFIYDGIQELGRPLAKKKNSGSEK
jgi:hypothetical protein